MLRAYLKTRLASFACGAVAPLVALSSAVVAPGCAAREASSSTMVTSLTSAEAPQRVDFDTALARARAARDRALAMRPPVRADLPLLAEPAIGDELRRWSEVRRDATQDAHRAYTDALDAAPGAAAQAQVYGELADLWLRLGDDARSALFAATPTSYRDDPTFVTSVEGASAYALAPLYDRVGRFLDACRALGVSNRAMATRACDDAATRFREAGDPRGPTLARRDLAAPAPAPEAPRAIVATTHPKPCTFKGTLVTRGPVYADESGARVALPLDRDATIEVESLAVPQRRGGRYRVVVSWPKSVEGWLDASEAPLVVARRLDSGDASAWASAGEAVTASDARGPTVEVARASRDASAGKGERRMFCHDLELATPRPRG